MILGIFKINKKKRSHRPLGQNRPTDSIHQSGWPVPHVGLAGLCGPAWQPPVSRGPRCSGGGSQSTRGTRGVCRARSWRPEFTKVARHRWAAGLGGDGGARGCGGAPVSNSSFWLTLQLRWGEKEG
jgi:hypothetical protein